MKRIFSLITIVIVLIATSCTDKYEKLTDGLYAEIVTTKGTILLALEYKKSPITVANFVTLAEGTNTFVSDDYKNKSFYDGLKFHRVVENFMIQGGDPLGNGTGDAGYKFKDEFSDLKFDKSGLLAMANSGPGTNSSQFFITHVATPFLNEKHTIFGHVVEKGMDVVNTIVQDDVINAVKIIRKGEDAKKFDAVKVFSDYFSIASEDQKKQAKIDAEAIQKVVSDKLAFLTATKLKATKTPSGVQYSVLVKGSGKKPANETSVLVAYSGYLENGELFDSSDVENLKAFGKLDLQRAAQNGYQVLPYVVGKPGQMIPGLEEILNKLSIGDKAVVFIPSNLAYGENGAGNVIPPNANITFEVELLENK